MTRMVEVFTGAQAENLLVRDRPAEIVLTFANPAAGTGFDVPLNQQILAVAERYGYSAQLIGPAAIKLHRDVSAPLPSWSSSEIKTMRHVGHPALGVEGRPAEDIDPLREYHGPLSEAMGALRDTVIAVRQLGGISSSTPAPEALQGAIRLGEAFLWIGPEYAQKVERYDPPAPIVEEPARRRFFKRPTPPAQPDPPSVLIWWAFGGPSRDGSLKWPGWSLVNGQVKGPGLAWNTSSMASSELSPVQVGLTLLADEPSGDVASKCANSPEGAWDYIRYGGGWQNGDMLDRAARAFRFVLDTIAPG